MFSLLCIFISFIFCYSPHLLRSESCFLSLSRDRVLCLLDPTPLSAGSSHGRHQSQENLAAFPPRQQERPETTNNLSMILVPNLYFDTLDV